MGTAKGIYPGRVTWAHDPKVTKWDGRGFWFNARNDQQTINRMISSSLNMLTGKNSDSMAWDALFEYFNKQHRKTNTGYQTEEKIALKVNWVNSRKDNNPGINVTPELVSGICRQLVDKAGVKQKDITIYDVGCGIIPYYMHDYCIKQLPDIIWKGGEGNDHFVNSIKYSASTIHPGGISQTAHNADYIINIAILKLHGRETGVTLCGKNHVGSIGAPASIHTLMQKKLRTYDPRVDLMGHRQLGGKTLLYIIDGLYGAPGACIKEATPVKWKKDPFNNHWPSSIFMSLDGVAIDSVGLDFLRSEWPGIIWSGSDNYLHEAALAHNPPSGTIYDPEGNGGRLESLGLHEHWNNNIEKKYSRNLGKDNGIELIKICNIHEINT